MLRIVCWKWKAPAGYRSQFNAKHVNVLRSMVERNYRKPHEVVCITDDPSGIDDRVRIIPLWDDHAKMPSPHGAGNPSCYRRLKRFSAQAAEFIGPRFVSVDLDCVITGDVAPLWDREEDAVFWGDTNPTTPYNGSMILLRAGTRTKVWDEFDPQFSPAKAKALGYFGSDQAWIGAALGPNEPKWSQADGVYSYRCDLKHRGGRLPPDAKIVLWHGNVDPWSREGQRLDWVRKHWV